MSENKIIYSQNFKQWFGDWENNPQNASKVVDKNGYPLVVYHGSDSEFNEFKSNFIGSHGTSRGQGFYFTSDRDFSGNFGENIKAFYLNIRKPLSKTELTLTRKQIQILIDNVDKVQSLEDEDSPYGILSNYGDTDLEGRDKVLKYATDLEYNSSDNDVELIGGIINSSGSYDVVISTLYKMFGYDGIIDETDGIYVAHHANQIKEVSNQTYNKNSNNMYENKKSSKRIFVTESQYMQLINEITIKDKYEKETQVGKNKLPYDVFEFVCNIDPTTKPNKVGKFANWLLAKYDENTDWQRLKVAMEWYADGLKRGIITRNGISNDINSFKSYSELINAINSLKSDSNTQMSTSEYNNRNKLEGQYEVVGSTSRYDIVKPLTFEAERYFGSGTAWCTVANIQYFKQYTEQGPLFIIYPKNGDKTLKMQFHFESGSFADYNDNVHKGGGDCIESVVTDENEMMSLITLCKKIFNKKYFITIEDKIEALKTMTKIPNGYFKDSKIKEIVIPNNITSIGNFAFEYCRSLISVTIPNNITSIGENAFCGCNSLTSVTIPDSVTSIGREAFYGCSSLTSVAIPNSVTSIGREAFYGCSGELIIDSNALGFYGGKFTKLTIGNGVTSIGRDAFCKCSSLTSITIPDSVTSIGFGAFYWCSSLTSVTIPDSVTEIGEGAFSNCSSLTSVKIPNSITSIGEGVFPNCSSLTSVTIPDSVTSIGEWAFGYCCSLISVTIPDSVTEIGDYAFGGCNYLNKVIAPSRFAEQFKKEYKIDIIPSDRGNIGESISNKRIFVTEEQYNKLTELLKEDSRYYVDPVKVKIVKKFLDAQFKRGSLDSMGSNGYPKRTNIFAMKGNNDDVVRNLSLEQMVDLLEDKFHHIFTERDKRDRFFKQILKDWYYKKITKEGLLSTYMF